MLILITIFKKSIAIRILLVDTEATYTGLHYTVKTSLFINRGARQTFNGMNRSNFLLGWF